MKKLVRFMCVALCVCFAAVVMTGCSDKVEKIVVGEWEYDNGVIYVFKDDGMVYFEYGPALKYKHDGDGTDDVIGHYEIIVINEKIPYALPDNDTDSMYLFQTDGSKLTSILTSHPVMTRKKK